MVNGFCEAFNMIHAVEPVVERRERKTQSRNHQKYSRYIYIYIYILIYYYIFLSSKIILHQKYVLKIEIKSCHQYRMSYCAFTYGAWNASQCQTALTIYLLNFRDSSGHWFAFFCCLSNHSDVNCLSASAERPRAQKREVPLPKVCCHPKCPKFLSRLEC